MSKEVMLGGIFGTCHSGIRVLARGVRVDFRFLGDGSGIAMDLVM
jgi:hypothetical protein